MAANPDQHRTEGVPCEGVEVAACCGATFVGLMRVVPEAIKNGAGEQITDDRRPSGWRWISLAG